MVLPLSILFLAAPLTVLATEAYCPNSEILVKAGHGTSHESVCEAMASGNAFLETVGLKFSGSLTVSLYNELPKNGQEYSVGYYDSHSNEIRILDYAATLRASKRLPPAFGVDMNPVIWRSYMVHEFAHAAAQKKFKYGVSVCSASEYIASVAQLASLPPIERENILRNYPDLTGFDRVEEITMAFYMLDPGKFSVNAYLHYSKPGHGIQFINRLLCEGLTDD